jgi:AraC-like DNA-binding protein
VQIHSASERTDGPSAIAIWGSNEPGDEFRLGTRELDWHHHERGQLFCIESGLIRIHTHQGSWLLPPQRVGWLPPRLHHKVTMSGVLNGWGVMLRPDASQALPDRLCVMGISELLRALVRRAAAWTYASQLSCEQENVVAVLLDEIRAAPQEPLHLPMPNDRRILRIANSLIKWPNDSRTLREFADWAGLSERTARRLFAAETGMSFAQWRREARLTLAMERLARHDSVADVAEALGYATPSNFIAMFRRTFGEPPARYFSNRTATRKSRAA